MATGVLASLANADLTAKATTYPFIKLHTGDPGAAGTANVATNTTRVQASFAAPSGGVIATSAELRWDAVPAGEDYTHWSGWTLVSGGAVGWSGLITADAVASGNNFVINSGGLTFSYTVMA